MNPKWCPRFNRLSNSHNRCRKSEEKAVANMLIQKSPTGNATVTDEPVIFPDGYERVKEFMAYFHLKNYNLGKNNGRERNNQKTEILFIERCIQFIKPGTGKIAYGSRGLLARLITPKRRVQPM